MYKGGIETRQLLRRAVRFAAGSAGAALAVRAAIRLPRRIDFGGKSVVITGGSRGLGLELARRFAREGARLALIARDPVALSRAAQSLRDDFGADVQTWVCELRDPAQIEAVVSGILAARAEIDVLINNAGVIRVGPVETMTSEDFSEALSIHMEAPLRLMQLVAPRMKAAGGGRIVNISSIGGLVPVPHLAPYVTSKYALTGLSEAMRAELAPHGVYVTTVCPGLMRTGSHVRAFFRGQPEKEFTWFSLLSANPLASTSSSSAARRIIQACRYGVARVILTPQAKSLHLLHAIAPGVISSVNELAARLLPAAGREPERPGWKSGSRVAPSAFTHAADRQVKRNNELDDKRERFYREQ